MNKRKLFKGKRVLLEDGLQEAGILVGDKGKIEKILRKDELETVQHDVEVSRKKKLRHTESVERVLFPKCCSA
jgi:hypothetical protein